jgi:hypothetical protein
MSLAGALALTAVIGISAAFASALLYILVSACFLPGLALGWFSSRPLSRVSDWHFPAGASFVAQVIGFVMFAVTANVIFFIGFSLFLFGVLLCGLAVGVTLRMAHN